MRYVLKLAYRGTDFIGWQVQPTGSSVQGELEEALTTILQQKISVTGCGRTDAGVHASNYYAHFDAMSIPDNLVHRLNVFLPDGIVVSTVSRMSDDFHARFDAVTRSYRYKLIRDKDPFQKDLAYRFPNFSGLNIEKLDAAADLLLEYQEFRPFCKSRSGVEHYKCHLSDARWIVHDTSADFKISSNRFLRGMVRLAVGMCLNVATDKISLQEVRESLDQQQMLPRPWSVPAHGLYLEAIEYDHDTSIS